MKYFKLTTTSGVSIVRGSNLRSVKSSQLKEHGTRNFESIEIASDDDLVRQEKWGGWIPEEIRVYVKTLQMPESPLRKKLLTVMRKIIEEDLAVAKAIASEHGLSLRVGFKDGKVRLGTADFVPTRINCVVNNNVVTDVSGIG